MSEFCHGSREIRKYHWKSPPFVRHWQTWSHKVLSSTPHNAGSLKIALISQLDVNPTIIRSRPWVSCYGIVNESYIPNIGSRMIHNILLSSLEFYMGLHFILYFYRKYIVVHLYIDSVVYYVVQSSLYITATVPENMAFMSSCPLYTG
jgi:hypothetical protein